MSTVRNKRAFTILFALGVLTSYITPAEGGVMASEDFNSYSVGPLHSGNSGGAGWTDEWGPPAAGNDAHVIDTTADPLAFEASSGLLSLNGGSRAMQATGGTSNASVGDRRLESPLNSTFYAGYLIRYTNAGAGDFGGNNTYSLHFSDSATNTNSFNLGIRSGDGGSSADNFMVRHQTGSPQGLTGGQLTPGEDYFLVARVNHDGSGFTSMEGWLNPAVDDFDLPEMTTMLTSGAAALSQISHVFFRQASNQADDVFTVDELVIGSTWEDVVGLATPQPMLQVNLGTGATSLTNTSGTDVQVVGYSIRSAAGSLSPSGWNPLANSDADWSTTSSTTSLLAENDAVSNGVAVADGGSPVSLGNAYFPSPFADLEFMYQLDGQSVTAGSVEYLGAAPQLGDFNRNGMLDNGDFAILAANSYTDLSGESKAGAYFLGDVDFDGDNDYDDFQQFGVMFDAANGTGAFQDLLSGSQVPEPASLALICLVAVAARAIVRRKRKVPFPPADCGI